MTQDHVGFAPCGFKSRPRHQEAEVSLRFFLEVRSLKETTLFETKLFCGTREEFCRLLEKRLEQGEKTFVVTMNASILLAAIENEEYRNVINEADVVIPDGAGVVWALKFLRGLSTERFPGIEIMTYLCELSKEKGWKVYLLGAKEENVRTATGNLKNQGVNVVGFHNGYFQDEEEVVRDINEKRPHLLFVGMGVPKQELWIHKNFPRLEVVLAMGVGGSIDVISGKKRRAPKWIQAMNLEWLYRFFQSPLNKRRVPIQIAKFVFYVFREKLKKKN